MLGLEFNKLKAAKSEIRKAIQRKNTGLLTTQLFTVYPDFIENMVEGDPSFDNEGLLEYCEDYYTNITINTNKIRDYAFYSWSNLHCLIIPSETLVPLGEKALEGTSIVSIIVPQNLVEQYKTDLTWRQYKDLISSTSNDLNSYISTNLTEQEEQVRTLSFIEGLTIQELNKDYR